MYISFQLYIYKLFVVKSLETNLLAAEPPNLAELDDQDMHEPENEDDDFGNADANLDQALEEDNSM